MGAESPAVPLDARAGESRAAGDHHESVRRGAGSGEAEGRDVPHGRVCDRAAAGGGGGAATGQLNAERGSGNAERPRESQPLIPRSEFRLPGSQNSPFYPPPLEYSAS